jgi:hypothetical protein
MAINPDVVRRAIDVLQENVTTIGRLVSTEATRCRHAGDPVGAVSVEAVTYALGHLQDDLRDELSRHVRQEYPK